MSKKLKKQKKFTRPLSKTQNHYVKNLLDNAVSLQKVNQLDKAEEIYKKILSINPRHAATLNFLGLIFQQKGNYDAALQHALRAVKIYKDAGYYSNLGSAYRGCGNLPKAVESFRLSLKLNPHQIEAKYNLASTMLDSGDTQKAEDIFRKITQLNPRMVEAHEGLRQALYKKGDFKGAISCADLIIKLSPKNIDAKIHKAMALEAQKLETEALTLYQSTLQEAPNNHLILNNIGNILGKQGHLHDSLTYYKKAIDNKPDFIAANTNLAWTYLQHGMLTESIDCYKSLLTYHPHALEVYSDLLFTLNYDPTLTPKQFFELAQQWWHKYEEKQNTSQRHPQGGGPDEFSPFSSQKRNNPLLTRKQQSPKSQIDKSSLRVGFVSPDLRQHPVGLFLSPLFTEINKCGIETFCYSELHPKQEDEVTAKLKKHVNNWYITHGQNDDTVIKQIVSDKIDILIDLAGHSANNRLSVFAKQPAPIQVSWLGYVNTTGLPVIQYRFTDAEADPPGCEEFHSETLIRLPNGFFCYSPPNNCPDISETPAIKKGHITFGSFNNLVKISECVVQTWASILVQTPKSKLVMVSEPLTDTFIRNRFKKLFAKYAIEPNRLEMHGQLPTDEYLAMHNNIDIALDPFPHNGHTITCNTLWMGVPVISLCGDRYASRMGNSIMKRINLQDLVASNKKAYVTKAAALAANIDQLSSLRSGMRQRLRDSSMCKSKQFCQDFTHALRQIWEEHKRLNQNNQ